MITMSAALSATAARPDALAMGMDDLAVLMQAMNETAERLQGTHVHLRREVARLKSELAEANAQLRRSRQLAALGEMAAGIAHEVRNPLGSIRLYAQALGEDLAEMPQQATLCEKIERAVTGLDAIVHDVLVFARESRPRPVETAAGALVRQSLASCDALVAETGVLLDVEEAAASTLSVRADRCLLPQAIGNVVRNAIEAVSEAGRRGRVAIRIERRRLRDAQGRRATWTVFSVRDDGPGIPPDVEGRMFNPFFTTRPTGTGLGLAIVHRIVDAHGGRIAVANPPEGGACVEICLPPHPASPDSPEAPTAGSEGS